MTWRILFLKRVCFSFSRAVKTVELARVGGSLWLLLLLSAFIFILFFVFGSVIVNKNDDT